MKCTFSTNGAGHLANDTLDTMAGHLIRRLNQHATQVFSRRMQERGLPLTPVQFAALDVIASAPGIDQAGVAARIAYDRATIGGVIDRLDQRGYVTRTVARHDRRARTLHLTVAGAALLDTIRPEVIALQSDILHGLDPTERAQFMALAARIIAATAPENGDG